MRVVVRHFAAEPPPPLAADEVHVWLLNLDRPPPDLSAALTPDEAARAARYRADRVRAQFVAGRGLLRTVLAGYLGVGPRAVPITYERSGKPTLPGGPHFNLTHTPGLGLVAVAGRRVGVDVERVRDVANADDLVRRFFSAAERAAFEGLDTARKRAAFFRGWTCKEALIKAVGASVQSLDAFDVDLDPACPPRVGGVRHPELAACPWSLATWEPLAGFAAAVAVEGEFELNLDARPVLPGFSTGGAP